MKMTITIYDHDGNSRTIDNVVHILQHSHSLSEGLDIEVMVDPGNLRYKILYIHLKPNEFYSVDI